MANPFRQAAFPEQEPPWPPPRAGACFNQVAGAEEKGNQTGHPGEVLDRLPLRSGSHQQGQAKEHPEARLDQIAGSFQVEHGSSPS